MVAWTTVVAMKVINVSDSGCHLKTEPKRSANESDLRCEKKEKSQGLLLVFGLRDDRKSIVMESL